QLKDGQPFAFAGLWEVWKSPDDKLIRTCTIITTEPNALLKKIHDRMPLVLPPKAYALWRSPGELPAETTPPRRWSTPGTTMRRSASRRQAVKTNQESFSPCLTPPLAA